MANPTHGCRQIVLTDGEMFLDFFTCLHLHGLSEKSSPRSRISGQRKVTVMLVGHIKCNCNFLFESIRVHMESTSNSQWTTYVFNASNFIKT